MISSRLFPALLPITANNMVASLWIAERAIVTRPPLADTSPRSMPTLSKPSRSTFIPVRGLRYHVREWGDASAPKLFLLHGWMDVSASFQFTVDELQRHWFVIAPDW